VGGFAPTRTTAALSRSRLIQAHCDRTYPDIGPSVRRPRRRF
jgi:hypothetical protein